MTSDNNSARVLVLAEHDHQKLAAITARLITAAQNFNLPVDILVIGTNCQSVAEQASQYAGVSRILLAEQPEFISRQVEDMTACLLPLLQSSHDILLVAANASGRQLVPRLAAQLDVSPLSDVVQILSPDRFVRPIHAGAILIEVKMLDQKKLMNLRLAGFEPATMRPQNIPPAELTLCPPFPLANLSRQIGEEFFWDQSALEEASIVIGLGGGALATENFIFIEKIAAHLGAVIGGSKGSVDLGVVPGNELIGQSGKTIAPKLYLALGISGAAQHLAGIRNAQVIVAINKDPDAPIFKVADYGLVGDLNELLPQIQKALCE